MSTSRCAAAARVMQPKVTTTAEGAAAEGAAAAAAMAAGSARPPLLLVLWASSQLNLKSRAQKLQWALFASFATYMALRTGLPAAPDRVLFLDSTFRDSTAPFQHSLELDLVVASLVEAKAISARDKQLRQDLVTPAEVYSREHAFTANVTLDFSLLVGDRLDGDSASMLWSDVPAQTPIWQLVDAIAFTLDVQPTQVGLLIAGAQN